MKPVVRLKKRRWDSEKKNSWPLNRQINIKWPKTKDESMRNREWERDKKGERQEK